MVESPLPNSSGQMAYVPSSLLTTNFAGDLRSSNTSVEVLEVFGFTPNKIVANNVRKCDNYVVEAIYHETIDVEAGSETSVHDTEFITDESIDTSSNGKRSFVCDFCICLVAAIVIVIGIFFIVNTFVKMI
jgi:hypothetical protein